MNRKHSNHLPDVSQRHSLSFEGLRFLQARVSAFALIYAALTGFFLIFRTLLSVIFHGPGPADLTHVLHASGVAVFLTLGLFLRGPRRSERAVRALDAVGVLMGSAMFIAMEPSLPPEARPELLLLLVLTIGMVAHAVCVPSTPGRTLMLSFFVGAALLVVTYVTYHRLGDEQVLTTVSPLFHHGDPAVARGLPVVMTAAWWAVIATMTATISRVIHRLRKEVSGIRKLGQYELEEKLGEGGMGVVYRARHALLRRPTAIKLMQSNHAGPVTLARFEREVQLTARLSHPNTVTVFDYGHTPENVFYYAMELLEGSSLQRIVDRCGPLAPARVRKILIDVSGALTEAHGVGLIHRDIKPANIMLAQRGGVQDVAKVLDFGLVKDLRSRGQVLLTDADALTGTPHYMAPEVIDAPDTVDARSDIYALGAVGYFLLTGHTVFDGTTFVQVCSQHLWEQPETPSQRLGRALPEDLSKVIMACLQKSPAARPASANELQNLLIASASCGEWTRGDGERWWAAHGAALKDTSEADAYGLTSAAATVAIDWKRGLRPSKPPKQVPDAFAARPQA